jgi:hypothetical protein
VKGKTIAKFRGNSVGSCRVEAAGVFCVITRVQNYVIKQTNYTVVSMNYAINLRMKIYIHNLYCKMRALYKILVRKPSAKWNHIYFAVEFDIRET